ncbi:MAG: CRTAC1 family protein, partial [Geminicoccaceae bacterium]
MSKTIPSLVAPSLAAGLLVAVTTTSHADGLGHPEGESTIAFEDVTAASGLDSLLDCMMGHTAAVGDLDGDGFPDLFFGSFGNRPPERYLCAEGPRPDRLLSNRGDGTFTHLAAPAIEQLGRASGSVFADFDNDGDFDLVVARNAHIQGDAPKTRNSSVYRNDGGSFVDIAENGELVPPGMRARNVLPLDYDGDGFLDLFIVDDMLGKIGSRLLRNEGDFVFRDQTAEAGLPAGLGGLGAAVGDVNKDGWPDLFVANRDLLLVNDGAGRYQHAAHLDAVFQWPHSANMEDWRAGAAFGDVNRDGLLDLVVGHHYDSAAKNQPQSVRLYLNRSTEAAVMFEDVTSKAALPAIPMKAPHVEIQDMDNDGWPDLLVSVHVVQDGKAMPLILRNRGGADIPNFDAAQSSIPTDRDAYLGYWPGAPTLDFDRDGRLDILGVEWFPSLDSPLFRNVSKSGNYLDVMVRQASGTNAMGIGAHIEIFESGRLGERGALIGFGEITTGYGYSSGQEALVHVGLADREAVDIRVSLPHGGTTIERKGVAANQRLL